MGKIIKEYIRKIKKSSALAYFFLLMVIFLPSAITMPSLSFRCAIITALGLDTYQENQVEISALTLSNISKDNMNESTKLISAYGQSVADAVVNLESQIGRKILMGHVGYIAISQQLATDDITKLLSSKIITSKLPNTVSLIVCNDTAKNLLDQANKLEQSSSYKLREVIQNEFNGAYSKDTSVDAFLKGYYSEISTSTLAYISLEQNDNDGINAQQGTSGGEGQQQSSKDQNQLDQQSPNASGGSSGASTSGGSSGENSGGGSSGSGGGESSQTPSVISFKNQHAVFVDGKFKYVLSTDEMKGLNWIVENKLQRLVKIKNYTGQGLKNADLSFDALDVKIKPVVMFRNNKPIITFDIDLSLQLLEILQQDKSLIASKELYLDEEIDNKINDEIKKDIFVIIKKIREEKTDILNAYNIIYNYNHKEFTKFLDTLPDEKDFLNYIQFRVTVSSKLVANQK